MIILVDKLADEDIDKIMDDYCYFICGYTEREFRSNKDIKKIINPSINRPLTYMDIDILVRVLRGELAKFRSSPIIDEYSYRKHIVERIQDLIPILFISVSRADENVEAINKIHDIRIKFLQIAILELIDILISIGLKYIKPSFWSGLQKISIYKAIDLEFPKK